MTPDPTDIRATHRVDGLPGGHPLPEPVNWHELFSPRPEVSRWTIEPLVPRGRQIELYAPKKMGKTLVTQAITTQAATGHGSLGQPAMDPIRVSYLDFENPEDDLLDRTTDMGYGLETASDLSALRYYLQPQLPPLDTPEASRFVEALLKRDEPDLVVIDTLNASTQGDEDSSNTYRAFSRYTGSVLRQHGVAMLRLDHAGRDVAKGPRGSSAKGEDVDVVVRLTTKGHIVTLTATDSRVPWYPKVTRLRQDLDPLRYVLLDQGDGEQAGTTTTDPLGALERAPQGLTAPELAALLADGGEPTDTDQRQARRMLDRLARDGKAHRLEPRAGGTGGSRAARYVAVTDRMDDE